jgi:hypothetical protein
MTVSLDVEGVGAQGPGTSKKEMKGMSPGMKM